MSLPQRTAPCANEWRERLTAQCLFLRYRQRLRLGTDRRSAPDAQTQIVHPDRYSRRTYCAAAATFLAFILGPSQSRRLPTPTRMATQPKRMISVRYAAMSKLE